MSNNSGRLGWDSERSLAATSFNGTLQNIGTVLTHNPVIIIFDNQTDVEVPIYADDVLWKTFSAGEAIIEDLRSNIGIASNYTIDLGTQFKTDATVGTSGSFRISIQYAR
jgi:hypothetical protein